MNQQEAFQNLREAIRERRETFERVNLFEEFEHFRAFLDYVSPSVVAEIEHSQGVVKFVLAQSTHAFTDRELFAAAKAEEISYLSGNVFEQAGNEWDFVRGFSQVESLENQFLILAHRG
jgi:hypothetical protein